MSKGRFEAKPQHAAAFHGRLLLGAVSFIVLLQLPVISKVSFQFQACVLSSSTTTSFETPVSAQKHTFDWPQLQEEVRLARQSHRPYGRYCSTSVLNEQQLHPFARKKVLSFTLFHAHERGNRKFQAYADGLKANIRGAALYYPDWIVRVFTAGLSNDDIDDIIQIDPSRVEVVVCNENQQHYNTINATASSVFDKRDDFAVKAVYRFFAYDDPAVDVVLSRDADSRFSPRELLAVNEWLASSEYCFHVMQDHKMHIWEFPILAGMFGLKRRCLDNGQLEKSRSKNVGSADEGRMVNILHADSKTPTTSMASLLDRSIENQPRFNYFDQFFLRDMIHPLVVRNSLYHTVDVRTCATKFGGNPTCKPFPLDHVNKDNPTYFIGETIRGNNSNVSRLGYECAVECKLDSLY